MNAAARDYKTIILDAISFIARFYMAYIWLKAGYAKIGNHRDMTQAISAYNIFTQEWSSYLAQLIGPLELAGGILLLLGIFLKSSSKVSAFVLILFMIGIGQAWARGLAIDCGCFRVEGLSEAVTMNYLKTLLRDCGYLFLTLWTIYRPFRKFAVYPQ
ncbi:DoxX family membrane protein [Staphylococcus chromogenes]|nr:DoxX family membrane protein [Staphylococcus chromogenes]